MTVRPFKRAIGFVDWHTAVLTSGAATRPGRQDTIAEKTLRHVERIVSDCLKTSAEGWKFEVRLRLYAGWHSGKTRTDYFHGIDKVIGTYASKTRSYHAGCVAFRGGNGGIQLGDKLACVPGRLARQHGVHLLDTLRRRRDGKPEEKMVDTALVVDLLGLVNRKEADRYLVVSDDDDMLPGIFAAEAAGAASMMLSRPGMSSRFMAHAADLVHTYQSVET